MARPPDALGRVESRDASRTPQLPHQVLLRPRRRGTYTAAMVPWCDVIPRRTHPWVTTICVACIIGLGALAWLQPILRATVVLWLADAWVVLLAGPAAEDRLGRLRFGSLLVGGAVAGLLLPTTLPGLWAVPPSVAAAGLAAHLMVFPGSRVLAISVGWPYSVHEIPMHAIGLVWTVARVGLWTLVPASTIVRLSLPSPLVVGAAAIVGGAAALLLRRPERESPDWWDTGGPATLRRASGREAHVRGG